MTGAWFGAYDIPPEWRVSPVNLEIDCSQAGESGSMTDCVINYSVVRARGGYFGEPCQRGAVELACDLEDPVRNAYFPEIDAFSLEMGVSIGAYMEVLTRTSEYQNL